jgi:hypothetical protein
MIVRALAIALLLGCTPPPPAVAPTPMQRSVEVPLVGRLGRYAGRFDIGGASFGLAIDTGSQLLAVAGLGCASCDRDGATAYYEPGKRARSLHRQVHGAYDEGQLGWTGDAFVDTVTADGLAAPVVVFAMRDETDIVIAGDEIIHADGIFGLAGSGATNWPDALATTGVPDVFAIHKCETTGTLWLGGGGGSAQYVASDTSYEVALHCIAIGSASFALPTDTQAVVDSGTAGLVVPPAIYDAILAELDRNPTFQTYFGSAAAWFAHTACTRMVGPASVLDRLPPVTLELDGITLTIPATESYAMPWSPDEVCPTLSARDGWLSVGDLPMRSHTVVFDRAAHRLGFAAPTPCND